MLSQEDNELLVRVGPGTAMGELLRRYWQPAALSEELPHHGAPVPVRLLGEDLVLFRDDAGRPGLLGLICSHRGADLSYGRLEDGGLRCIYHGWLYDIHGNCLEQPGEPVGSTFYERVRHKAYPCQETAGVIFAYLGPGEPPLVPAYEVLDGPAALRSVTKIYRECNYLQANEGNLDSVHLSFLHSRVHAPGETAPREGSGDGPFDVIEPEETDYGLRVYWVRNTSPDRYFLHVTNFVLPNLCSLGGRGETGRGYRVNWHVPIDDAHHWEYVMVRGHNAEDIAAQKGSLRDQLTADYRLLRNASNRYLQDRQEMAERTYAGLGMNNYPQDACVTDPLGVQDRTREHLGYGDKTIIAMRNILLRSIREMQEGNEPAHVVRDPAENHFGHALGGGAVLSRSVDWRSYWEEAVLKPAKLTAGHS